MKTRELIIIGGGPAGMAAALSAHECGVRDILLLERDRFLGGILNQCIHTGFGIDYFKEILTGPEYAQRFIERIKAVPAIETHVRAFVGRVSPRKEVTFLEPGSLQKIKAKALILATGCRERTREMITISGSRPAGIFSAGMAQKLINTEGLLPGKKVVIIGSGDIGLIMARRFVLEGAEVKAVLEIQDHTSGLLRNVVQCIEDFNIPLYFRHSVCRIIGAHRVEQVEVAQVDDSCAIIESTRFTIDCDTVLLSVGLIPENELLEMAGAAIDRTTNTPISEKPNHTSIPGVFVCGNANKVYDYVDSVTVDSEKAGSMAAAYLGYKKGKK
jgi:NADPH-dependent 2,4-dienoyl-CoA reductase/sulfur reductase-like enzyme